MGTTTISPSKKALAAAADLFGGQQKLGDAMTRELGRPVSQQWISRVINSDAPIPPEWPLVLERLTDGKFNRRDFRPDLYPPEDRHEVARLSA